MLPPKIIVSHSVLPKVFTTKYLAEKFWNGMRDLDMHFGCQLDTMGLVTSSEIGQKYSNSVK